MADANTTAPKQPKVVNKSGTLKMTDEVAATKQTRDMAGRPMRKNTRRDRVKAENTPKEFEEITINIDRVSRTVKVVAACASKLLLLLVIRKTKSALASLKVVMSLLQSKKPLVLQRKI